MERERKILVNLLYTTECVYWVFQELKSIGTSFRRAIQADSGVVTNCKVDKRQIEFTYLQVFKCTARISLPLKSLFFLLPLLSLPKLTYTDTYQYICRNFIFSLRSQRIFKFIIAVKGILKFVTSLKCAIKLQFNKIYKTYWISAEARKLLWKVPHSRKLN